MYVLAFNETECTYRNQAEEHERQTRHVNRCTSEVREKKPADNATNNVAGRQRDVDVEGLDFGEAGSFEEYDTVAEDGITTKDLRCPDNAILLQHVRIHPISHVLKQTYDLSPSQICPLKALPETRIGSLGLLKCSGVLDISERCFNFQLFLE